MAFVSSGYNPDKPMENRISDIGPRFFKEFLPPVLEKNYGKWVSHEILEPGLLVHEAESGDKVYTVRVGSARLVHRVHPRGLRCRQEVLRRLPALDHPQQHRVHDHLP